MTSSLKAGKVEYVSEDGGAVLAGGNLRLPLAV